jgi:hypothetical protein
VPGVVGHPQPKSQGWPATPKCSGGGRTTPRKPQGSTTRHSRGGATTPGSLLIVKVFLFEKKKFEKKNIK